MNAWLCASLLFLSAVFAGCAAPMPAPAPAVSAEPVEFTSIGEAISRMDSEIEHSRASEAARTVALSNLLGQVKGFKAKGQTSVGDLMFTSQSARTEVNGIISRAEVTVELTGDLTHTAKATLRVSRSELDSLERYAGPPRN